MQEMVGNKIFSIILKLMHFKEKGKNMGRRVSTIQNQYAVMHLKNLHVYSPLPIIFAWNQCAGKKEMKTAKNYLRNECINANTCSYLKS